VTHIPEGVGVLRIINTYRYERYPEDKAYCAKCRAKRHRDGFTVELEDGASALLGSTCGADLWGQSWNEAHARFRNELDRAGIVIDLHRILPELIEIRQALEAWKPCIENLEAHQRLFKGRLATFYRTMRSAALRPDQSIVVPEQVRDYAAEDAYRQRTGSLPARPFFHSQDRVLCRIDGAAYFAMTDAKEQLALALEEIDHAIGVGTETQAHSQTRLRAYRLKLRDARERLDQLAQALRGQKHFFQSSEMKFILTYSGEEIGPGGRYAFEGDALVDRVAGTSITLGPAYRMVDMDPLKRLANLREA
jgi:hypothetical protein